MGGTRTHTRAPVRSESGADSAYVCETLGVFLGSDHSPIPRQWSEGCFRTRSLPAGFSGTGEPYPCLFQEVARESKSFVTRVGSNNGATGLSLR